MKDQDYLLTVQVPIKAIDDLEARSIAKRILVLDMDTTDLNAKIKLQKIYGNRAPEKLSI